MPKLKVPTHSLKRCSKQAPPVKKLALTERPAVKEKKNGSKTKEKLPEIFRDPPHNNERFVGFDLKAVMSEYAELSSSLPSVETISRRSQPRRATRTRESVSVETESVSEEESEASSPALATPPPQRKIPSALITKTGAVRKRGVRCMECEACLRPADCGSCDFCLDKPKFGGMNIKKQACIYRKCHNLIRLVPLKYPKKNIFIPPEGTPPPPRKPLGPGETRPLQASPIRPRRTNVTERNVTSRGKANLLESDTPTVKLFWPEEPDSVGLPIYSLKPHNKPSVCLLCGGAGQVVRCVICCQSFHPFCIGGKSGKPYTCPGCVHCRVCGLGGNCVSCVVCGGWFHQSCMRDHSSTRAQGSWRCVSCTKCLNCKTTSPGKPGAVWYDDYTYCKPCYSLKAKGNYCPLCGGCYTDSDYDSKMVQCGKCDFWVHASCEEMSDQDYLILSDLPEDDVLFLCRLCDKKKALVWKSAVDSYFHNSLAKLTQELGQARKEFIAIQAKLQEYSQLSTYHSDVLRAITSVESSLPKSCIGATRLRASREAYNLLLDELFPWFSEDQLTVQEIIKPLPSPLHTVISLPEPVSHDHCYWQQREKVRADPPLADSSHPDQRRCVLCPITGDTESEGPGRLLPCGVDEWVHVNCAVWSAEVYEELSGVLRSVQVAVTRGSRLRCDTCRDVGATVGCCTSSCSANYHFQCARKAKCVFLNNKEVFCHKHREAAAQSELVPDNELAVVDRCIFIDAHPDRPGRKMPRNLEADKTSIQLGSLMVSDLGQLRELSDTPTSLVPHGYKASCEFWSTVHPGAVTRYSLTVTAADPDDYTTHPDHAPSQATPTKRELGLPTVEIGGNPTVGSIWEELLPSPSKKQKQSVEQTPKVVQVTKLTNGITAMIATNQIVGLYFNGYASINGPGLITTSNSGPGVVNGPFRAIDGFKIPKKSPVKENPYSVPAAGGRDSEAAVRDSLLLRRLAAGAPGNPCSLSFTVTTEDGASWTNTRLEELWDSVLSELQEQRAKLDLPYVCYSPCDGYRAFGLTHPLVAGLVEQLPNASRCREYRFTHHQPGPGEDWHSLRRLDNPSGCARSEPFSGKRSPRDMFSFLTSDHRPEPPAIDYMGLEVILATAENTGLGANKLQTTSDLPAAMRYRSLQKNYKQHVGVFASHIHGLGLFCTKDIEPGDMVIEYTGTVIRSVLTDKREKIYDSKGIGCYMFRIDTEDVVDATMSGNQARFINHCCEPNCFSKVITVDGSKKIMIFALRKILPGEELTYDYKFPLEEAKIPCNCGARRCRKTMN